MPKKTKTQKEKKRKNKDKKGLLFQGSSTKTYK